jgi:multiple sugar transport system permease protein
MRKIWRSFAGKKAGRAFILPAVIILLLLTIFPFLFSLFLSFGKVSFLGGLKIHFAGLKNWLRLFGDERFYNALSNTILIAVIAVAIEYILGLGLAWLLNRGVKGSTFFRVLFFLPMMLAPIAVGYMWRMMFNPTRGPIDHVLSLLGFPAVAWLTEPKIVLYSIILTDIWHWTPFMILILFAGLQSIPPALLEAARVDGASGWRLFREIIFPLLIPVSIAAILLRTVEVFKIIDKIYILTGGGPGIYSESMTLFGYSLGLRAFDLAYGATIAFSLFATVLAISIIFLLITRRSQEISLE